MGVEKIDLGFGWSAELDADLTDTRCTHKLIISTRPDTEWIGCYTDEALATLSPTHLPVMLRRPMELVRQALKNNPFAMHATSMWGLSEVEYASQYRQAVTMRQPGESDAELLGWARAQVIVFVDYLRSAIAASPDAKAAAKRKSDSADKPLDLPVITQVREIISQQVAKAVVDGLHQYSVAHYLSDDDDDDADVHHTAAADYTNPPVQPPTPQVTLAELITDCMVAVRRTLSEQRNMIDVHEHVRLQLTCLLDAIGRCEPDGLPSPERVPALATLKPKNTALGKLQSTHLAYVWQLLRDAPGCGPLYLRTDGTKLFVTVADTSIAVDLHGDNAEWIANLIRRICILAAMMHVMPTEWIDLKYLLPENVIVIGLDKDEPKWRMLHRSLQQ